VSDFIVDASVVAKWFLPESHSDRARSLIDRSHYLRAPDLLLPELSNVFWKRVQRREMTAEEVEAALDIFLKDHVDVTVRLLPSRIAAKRGLRIAHTERCSAYGGLYLAFAMQSRCKFITADQRFVRSIRNPVFRQYIASLSDIAVS
jgi:predicted nucleic acid-binding protein